MSAPFFERDGFSVDANVLRTPRKTYALERIEYVSVKRSAFWITALIAIPVIGLTLTFIRYFYFSELMFAWFLAGVALFIAANVGVLKVRSLAIDDDEEGTTFGPIGTLQEVRLNVERAIAARSKAPAVS